MKSRKNILWIMADQLRWDYLSCYGHPTLHTPHLDKLATMGVRFNKAYVQSPVCGPSRMSFYTGRYMRSHGSSWNGFPLRAGEPTLGEHLREQNVHCWLMGKTHMVPDYDGMKRLGINPNSKIGLQVSECGFDVWERDDGTHPDGFDNKPLNYNAYLRRHGMDANNPWEEWANSAEGENGELLSGWFLENSHLPARVPKEHSETAYLTDSMIKFLEQAQDDEPWLCHLSYIKPHWPFMAPAPYNDMYSSDDIIPVIRSKDELNNPNPVLGAWQNQRVCKSFARDFVRERVAPVYMGLIKQLDDELGRLFDYLENTGRMNNTMIVFTADHGENMGDHWLGEKDMFYECSVKVPLIIYDPDPKADSTRGTTNDDLVEAIDLVPTFIEYFGGSDKPHIVEGHSLMPLLEQRKTWWRNCVFSEYDYSTREARRALGVDQKDARLNMVFDGRWKYIHCQGLRPMLFDLKNDPSELHDLGNKPEYKNECKRMAAILLDWSLQHHTRITLPPKRIEQMTDVREPPGILIGYWDEDEARKDGVLIKILKEQ